MLLIRGKLRKCRTLGFSFFKSIQSKAHASLKLFCYSGQDALFTRKSRFAYASSDFAAEPFCRDGCTVLERWENLRRIR